MSSNNQVEFAADYGFYFRQSRRLFLCLEMYRQRWCHGVDIYGCIKTEWFTIHCRIMVRSLFRYQKIIKHNNFKLCYKLSVSCSTFNNTSVNTYLQNLPVPKYDPLSYSTPLSRFNRFGHGNAYMSRQKWDIVGLGNGVSLIRPLTEPMKIMINEAIGKNFSEILLSKIALVLF